MADVPFYTQGTATGGLLGGLQNQQASQQSATGYVPGQGQAPMAPLQSSIPGIGMPFPGMGAAIQGAMSGAANSTGQNRSSDLLSLYESVKASPGGMTAGNWNKAIADYNKSTQSGGGGTTIGQSEPWLSPDEMKAKLDALQSSGASGGSSGGGGAGSSGGGAGASGGSRGLNLSGTQGNAPTGSTPGSLNQSSTPMSNTLGYSPVAINPGSTNIGAIPPGSTNNGGQAGVLQMQQANPQGALDQYKNTPGYQLLNAPGAYEQSPGYQYAMDQSMNQVQNAASAKGMLESGAVIKNMQQTASGLAQQDYGNWWNRQNQLYGDYQNRLQGMAGGPTGGADAMTSSANAAQANLQTGSNVGSLFGNQGTTGMGGIINTAAAQSGNMINAGQQQATVNAANQATQLAGATLASNQQQRARGLF